MRFGEFWYTVDMEITLSKPELEHIMQKASEHYDSVCKGSALQGGFLYGWRNQLGEDLEVVVSAKFQQLDTIAKILELPGSWADIKANVRNVMKAISEETRRLNKGWA